MVLTFEPLFQVVLLIRVPYVIYLYEYTCYICLSDRVPMLYTHTCMSSSTRM